MNTERSKKGRGLSRGRNDLSNIFDDFQSFRGSLTKLKSFSLGNKGEQYIYTSTEGVPFKLLRSEFQDIMLEEFA
ncbi:MAG: hypothetical protein ACFFAH_08840 [Promethearchaeota archaeon]